jgi:hypothetical protein
LGPAGIERAIRRHEQEGTGEALPVGLFLSTLKAASGIGPMLLTTILAFAAEPAANGSVWILMLTARHGMKRALPRSRATRACDGQPERR